MRCWGRRVYRASEEDLLAQGVRPHQQEYLPGVAVLGIEQDTFDRVPKQRNSPCRQPCGTERAERRDPGDDRCEYGST